MSKYPPPSFRKSPPGAGLSGIQLCLSLRLSAIAEREALAKAEAPCLPVGAAIPVVTKAINTASHRAHREHRENLGSGGSVVPVKAVNFTTEARRKRRRTKS